MAILVLGTAGAASAAPITNGGFETETPAGCQVGVGGLCSASLPGWTTNNGATVDTSFPNSGLYDVALSSASSGPGLLSQAVATTPGRSYTLTFSLIDESASPASTLTVTFGGFTAVITGDRVPFYTPETFSIPGANVTSAVTTLSFAGIETLSSFNIDDVALAAAPVAAVPEPTAVGLMVGGLAVLSALGLARRRR